MKKLVIDVIGGKPIMFSAYSSCYVEDEEKLGIAFDTREANHFYHNYINKNSRLYNDKEIWIGGTIILEDAIKLRDFLNDAIDKAIEI